MISVQIQINSVGMAQHFWSFQVKFQGQQGMDSYIIHKLECLKMNFAVKGLSVFFSGSNALLKKEFFLSWIR